jgi:hypothetical protein
LIYYNKKDIPVIQDGNVLQFAYKYGCLNLIIKLQMFCRIVEHDCLHGIVMFVAAAVAFVFILFTKESKPDALLIHKPPAFPIILIFCRIMLLLIVRGGIKEGCKKTANNPI